MKFLQIPIFQPCFWGQAYPFISCLCQSFIQPDVSRKRVSAPRHFVRCPHMCPWKWLSPARRRGRRFGEAGRLFEVKLVRNDGGRKLETFDEIAILTSGKRNPNNLCKWNQFLRNTQQSAEVVPHPLPQLSFCLRLCFWSTSGLGAISWIFLVQHKTESSDWLKLLPLYSSKFDHCET